MSTALWGLLMRLVGVMYSAKGKGRPTGVHWAAHQRFFRSMCMAGKVGRWIVGNFVVGCYTRACAQVVVLSRTCWPAENTAWLLAAACRSVLWHAAMPCIAVPCHAMLCPTPAGPLPPTHTSGG